MIRNKKNKNVFKILSSVFILQWQVHGQVLTEKQIITKINFTVAMIKTRLSVFVRKCIIDKCEYQEDE